MVSYQVFNGDVNPLPGDVLVQEMEQGFTVTKSGLILMDDSEARPENIKARWCKVYKVGSDVEDVNPGEWILVEHGRWTYGVKINNGEEEVYLQKVDPESILMVSTEEMDTGRTSKI